MKNGLEQYIFKVWMATILVVGLIVEIYLVIEDFSSHSVAIIKHPIDVYTVFFFYFLVCAILSMPALFVFYLWVKLIVAVTQNTHFKKICINVGALLISMALIYFYFALLNEYDKAKRNSHEIKTMISVAIAISACVWYFKLPAKNERASLTTDNNGQ